MNPVDEVFNMVETLKESVKMIELNSLKIGALLSDIKDRKLYLQYADHTRSMNDFLTEIDLGIKESQANHLIRIYRTFGAQLEARCIPMKRLLLIHPLVKDDPGQIDHWLSQAESLPLSGLLAAVQAAKGLIPHDVCDHPELDRYTRCRQCGKWFKETQ